MCVNSNQSLVVWGFKVKHSIMAMGYGRCAVSYNQNHEIKATSRSLCYGFDLAHSPEPRANNTLIQ